MNLLIDKINTLIEEHIGSSIEFNIHLIHYIQLKTAIIYLEKKEYNSAIEQLRLCIKSSVFSIHISSLSYLGMAYEYIDKQTLSIQCYLNIVMDISRYIHMNKEIDSNELTDLYKIKTKTSLKLANIYYNSNDNERALLYIYNILDYDKDNKDARELFEKIVQSNVSIAEDFDLLFK